MSFVFLSSIAASIAAVWLCIGLTGEFAALASVAVNTAVAAGGVSLFLAREIALHPASGLAMPLAVTLAAFAFGIALYFASRRLATRDPRPMPAHVRGAFAVFVVVLVVAGGALALQRQVFPWPLQPQSATVFGCVFLGAAAYFAHAVAGGRWALAAPPLAGFLAYDLVLIVPYARLLGAADAAVDDYYGGSSVNLTSLAIYLGVLITSAALALQALVLSPSTRLVAGRGAAGPAR